MTEVIDNRKLQTNRFLFHHKNNRREAITVEILAQLAVVMNLQEIFRKRLPGK